MAVKRDTRKTCGELSGNTNKNGDPCRAYARAGHNTCIAHADKATQERTGFGVGGGRPPKPRVVDVIRERVEADADKWYKVLDDARVAERPVVVGSGEYATVEMVPDHAIRIAAEKEAMDRSYGKPKQQTELSGLDGGPVRISFAELVTELDPDADQ